MTGRILARDDYRLQITYRTTFPGHLRTIVWMAIAAGVVVLGIGI